MTGRSSERQEESTGSDGSSVDVPTLAVGSPAPDEAAAPGPGSNVGRYVVLEEVGRGGMGRVLRAYDPKLQREVALKEVRGAALGTEGATRLVAEARAMAKLSHPNVVAVFDVEELEGGRVVLAMEYVDGETLRTWLRAEERPWHEVVRRFRGAGAGLAAAHAVGLLHRDFKPANVLVAGDVVKVTDFGLAKAGAGGSASRSDDGHGGSEDGHVDESSEGLTEAGVVLGTPRYMAPEQHRGRPLTAAADQYGFCVALWEALCGAAPFRGSSLGRAKAKGPPPWPGGPTPRVVAEAIRRGLSPAPEDRWPSMDALLDVLAYDPARRRRRWLAVGGGLAVVGLAAATWESFGASVERCTGARDQLKGAWDGERRAEVHDAVLATGASYAVGVWDRTAAALDDYAAKWSSMYTDACEATTVRGEQSTAAMDLRMACLHRAKVELGAVVDVLADADADVVRKAHELTESLRPLSRCADLEALQSEVEPPLPEEAEAVETVTERLATAKAAREAGRFPEARQAVDAAEEALAGVAYGPARTEVAIAEGELLDALGEYDAAEKSLREGLRLAAEGKQSEQMYEAARELWSCIGYEKQNVAEAAPYGDLCRALAEGNTEREAEASITAGKVLLAHGKYAEAEAEQRRALELWEAAVGPDHPRVATALNSLATAMEAQGRYAEAEAEYRRALDIWEATLGPEHPDVARAHNNIAVALHFQKKHAEAEAEYRRALEVLEAALGPAHPHVAGARHNLGNSLRAQKKYADAEVEQRRALEIWEAALGPEHPHVAGAHSNFAITLYEEGKIAEAVEEFRQALALRQRTLGPDHPDLAASYHNLADVLFEQGELEEAGPLAEAAWLGRNRDDVAPTQRGQSAFLLARVLWDGGDPGQRSRARDLAEEALAAFGETGESGDENIRKVKAWLDSHPARGDG